MQPAAPRTVCRRTALSRALRGACPACGGSRVFPGGDAPPPGASAASRAWLRLAAAFRHASACPACGWKFDRGPGHWVGGNEINLLVTYPVSVAAFAAPAVAIGPSFWTAAVGGVVALLLGFAVHRPSRCLFFAMDYLVDPDDASPSGPPGGFDSDAPPPRRDPPPPGGVRIALPIPTPAPAGDVERVRIPAPSAPPEPVPGGRSF
ncbi:MAG: hypothetical protein HMLKMBBP_01407 [Planctomycetes bacterium]|nr:hypothetical protein [Planctomycetota bacterium]